MKKATPILIRSIGRSGLTAEHRQRLACVGLADPEAYTEQVRGTMLFLRGKSRELVENIELEMLEAARRLEFEEAARLRDQIAQIRAMPDYGSARTVKMSDVEAPRARPGQARSRAGITGRGKKRGPRK